MAVDSISAAGGGGNLGQAEFIKLLLAQLTNQNPLEPMNNEEFVAQMAQFSALAQTQQLNEGMGTLLMTQASTQAVGLINKVVEVETQNGKVTGTVTQVAFSNAGPALTILADSGLTLNAIPLGQVQTLTNRVR
jgi:flagellar basal-body rod modification protein FlgD